MLRASSSFFFLLVFVRLEVYSKDFLVETVDKEHDGNNFANEANNNDLIESIAR